MINLLAYSGGADSGALAKVLIESGIDFTPVFCDTGWEHAITHVHINEFNERYFDNRLVVLKSRQFQMGMTDLIQIKGRVPSAKARFCTEHLKINPMKEYVFGLDDEVTIYQGIRSQESKTRSMAQEEEWSDVYDCLVKRPILQWSKDNVFAYHKTFKIPINPLYLLGAGRVGCFPCVLINHGELRRLSETFPEMWERMASLEKLAKGRSFFPPNYIPKRFQTGRGANKFGETVTFPTLEDVKRYVLTTDQTKLDYTVSSCMSIYNLCE